MTLMYLFLSIPDYSAPQCDQFDVRLTFREQGGATGDLEICVNNTWLAVCNNSPGFATSLPVTCQALGFTANAPATFIPPINPFNQQTFGGGFFCLPGLDQMLTDCDSIQTDNFCSPQDFLRISCPGEGIIF